VEGITYENEFTVVLKCYVMAVIGLSIIAHRSVEPEGTW